MTNYKKNLSLAALIFVLFNQLWLGCTLMTCMILNMPPQASLGRQLFTFSMMFIGCIAATAICLHPLEKNGKL